MSNIIEDWDKMVSQLTIRKTNIGIDMGINIFRVYVEDYELYYEKRLNNYDPLSEEYLIEKDIFTNKFRPSLFIMFYSFIEEKLELICYTFQYRYNLNDKVIDAKMKRDGNLLQKLRGYLINNCSINFPNNNNWIIINTVYNRLRNNIVHNAGKMPELPKINTKSSKKMQIEYIKKLSDINILKIYINKNPSLIRIDNLKRFNLSKEFLFEVINTIESFFNEFLHAWSTWITSPTK